MPKLKRLDYIRIVSEIKNYPYVLNKHGPCPICGGEDRFRFTGDGSRYYCNTCPPGHSQNLLDILKGDKSYYVELKPQRTSTPEEDELFINSILHSCRKGLNRETRLYIENRGLDPNLLKGLNWYSSQNLYYNEGKKHYPGIVLPITKGDKVISLHRTFIESGYKARVSNPKKMTKALEDMKGSSVPLMKYQDVLGTGEGLETCLSAYELTGIPVYPALNEILLRNFPIPTDIKLLVIFADYDEKVENEKARTKYPGQGAAFTLAARSWDSGIPAEVRFPPDGFKDWNDYLVKTKTP